MSVSLILLPVGLALYAVMGKKNFEKWVDSMQVKIPTKFLNESDLCRCVRKAGYDADTWGGMIKTHMRGEAMFFFWQKIDGVWTAVFAKSIPQSEIKQLIKKIEEVAGRQVFESDAQSSTAESATTPPGQRTDTSRRRITVLSKQIYPTNFRDRERLMRVLAEHALNPKVDAQGRIACETEAFSFAFTQQDDQPFTVEIHKAPQLTEVFQNLAQLNEDYCQVIQADAVRNVKSRLQEKGLHLEQEETLPDKTVVLTVQIP